MTGPDAAADPHGSGENGTVPRAPGGEPLTRGRRMPLRQARSWVRREDVLLGRWPCGSPVEWVSGQEREALAARVRHGGRDCTVAGDVLLFRLADGRRALVVEQRW